ncbi:endonuclease/exonuclease/phosphatase family protein [Saccharospirillum sp. HFRX-1]|uniref:endonuclease/exonuclease/phosphatase family protein n=1 Tax=unclassified Saccharospirillum TaxID=2633430 RepID=UPI003722CA65
MAADISFASFNLYNFQKAGLTTYTSTPISQKEYQGKRDWIRRLLIEVDADIVVFQELWHKDALDDVLSVAELSGYRTQYIADRWYNIAVAMIVRAPWQITSAEVIKKFPFTKLVKLDEGDGEDDEVSVSIDQFSRSIIKAQVAHSSDRNTPPFTLYACHLKSKLPARVTRLPSHYRSAIGSALSTIRRTAEATALRMMLIDQLRGSNTPVVVIGDLNDDPLSNTLSLITDQPTLSNRARGADRSLYSTLFFQQLKSFRDVYYTHEHNSHKGVLDHILVSEEFFEYSQDMIWKHQDTRIWNDHIDDDNPYRTDHGIIRSSFR